MEEFKGENKYIQTIKSNTANRNKETFQLFTKSVTTENYCHLQEITFISAKKYINNKNK